MIDKVNIFPIETFYFLESEDFLVHREKAYFRKNKTIKLNSYWIGVSRLRVNNDKLLYLFNGLRGYYDVRSRYIKEPQIMEKKVPLAKMIFVNDYLTKKYKYSDMFMYSLNKLGRPTITLKKENKMMYYSFPHRLVEYLNKKRDVINAESANAEFYKNVKDLKNVGFRYFIKPRKKYKGLSRISYISSVALGFTEKFLVQYMLYISFITRQRERAVKMLYSDLYRNKRKKRLKYFKRFFKAPKALMLMFVVSKKYLIKKRWRFKKKKKNTKGRNKLKKKL